jgi:carbonic anhydrase
MPHRFIPISVAAAVGATALSPAPDHHWSYSGENGPSHWSGLDTRYAACATGKYQSPIDIRTDALRMRALPSLVFDYRPTSLHIVDNGHTIQVDVDTGSYLRIGTNSYQLKQFHFHHPGEERVDGQAPEMTAHLVHRDSEGKLAVVAVPLYSGGPNSLIGTLWRHLPKQHGQKVDDSRVRINPAGLLPADRSYYTYTGSLTSPPCSEGVRWFVLKSASALSLAEIGLFATRYPNNARPIQRLNGRLVLGTN